MYNRRIQDMTRPLPFHQAMTSTGWRLQVKLAFPNEAVAETHGSLCKDLDRNCHGTASYKTWRITPDLWSSHGMTFRIFRAYGLIWWWYMMIYGYVYKKTFKLKASNLLECIEVLYPVTQALICWIYPIEGGQPYLVFQLPASHCIRFHSLHVQLMWARHVGLEGHAMVNTDDLIPGWWECPTAEERWGLTLREEWRSEKGWKREGWNSSQRDWLLNSIILQQSLVCNYCSCQWYLGFSRQFFIQELGTVGKFSCPFLSVQRDRIRGNRTTHGTRMDIYNRPGATVACWIQPPGSKPGRSCIKLMDPELTPSATCEKPVSSRVIRTYHKQTAWCVQTGSGFLHVSSGISRWWKQPWELK